MTEWSFDKFFDLQSFLMMVVLLLYENEIFGNTDNMQKKSIKLLSEWLPLMFIFSQWEKKFVLKGTFNDNSDEVITNVSVAIDAKYRQIALRSVLVHKPLNLGYTECPTQMVTHSN